MKPIQIIILLAAAAMLSACASLLPPPDISDQQIAGLDQTQLEGVRSAQQEIPQAQQEVVKASRALTDAENDYLVAEKYLEWKRKIRDRARAKQDLAQMHIAAIQARVEAEKAKALVHAHPQMAQTIDVNRYIQQATKKRADMQSQRNYAQSLDHQVAAAYTNFRAATEKFGGLQTRPTPANGGSSPEVSHDGNQNSENTLQTVPLGGG